MSYVTLDEVKSHANVEGEVTDSMLQLYIDSAEAHVSNYLNRTLDSLLLPVEAPAVPDAATFPKPVRHAILLLVTDSIENRGCIVNVPANVLPTFERLLYPYRLEIGV
jgi:hypothetical protein